MKLISLRLQNFRQHADSAIMFAPEGITGIVGSNESGKSSILEAIGWCLYGARATRGTLRGLRWHRAPARRVAAAVLDFEVGGRRYAIDRTESSAEILDVNQDIVIAQGTDAVNRYVPELLGMRLEEFSASYMAAQKDLARLASITPAERQAFVRRVLGLDRIDEALKSCRQRKNDLGRERDGLAAGLGDRDQLSAAMDAATKAVADVSVQLGTALRTRDQAVELDGVVKASLAESQKRAERHLYLRQNQQHLRSQIETADREIERVERERQEADLAARTLQEAEGPLADLPDLRVRHVELIQEQGRVRQRAQLETHVVELDGEIARLDQRAEVLQRTVAEYDEASHRSLEADLYNSYRPRLANIGQLRAERIAAYRQASEQAAKDARTSERKLEAIRKAGSAGNCPTCQRELQDAFDLVVAELDANLAEAQAIQHAAAAEADSCQQPMPEERELSERVRALEREIDGLRREEAAADAAQRQLGEIEGQRERGAARLRVSTSELSTMLAPSMGPLELDAAIHNIGVQISELERLDRELEPMRAKAARVDALAEERNARVAARAETVEHIGQIMTDLRELAFDAAGHELFVQAAREASEARQAAELEAARSEEAHGAALAQCERAERALADYDARAGRLEELTRELRTHTAAAERLDAFRVAQASAIRPELEELTTGFVSLLTDGRHDGVTIPETFDLILSESGVDTEIISGGTEDVAALAMRLAISQMIAMRAGHPLSLLVLDEPFGSLDAVRRGNVMSLIRRLRGIFEQVLLISHIEETRDSADHVIELEYSEAEGRSRVIQTSTPVLARELEAVPA